ncbi:MAG: small subunit ribosomal protein S1 [Rhodothermales bacterium]|jgi:small subunit ribosomal protein S1
MADEQQKTDAAADMAAEQEDTGTKVTSEVTTETPPDPPETVAAETTAAVEDAPSEEATAEIAEAVAEAEPAAEVAEAAAEAEPVAEAAVEAEPVAEAAVEAEPVAEAAAEAEPVAEAAAEAQPEAAVEAEPEAAAEAEPEAAAKVAATAVRLSIGYKGEITGKVYKLDELNAIDADDTTFSSGPAYDALRTLVEGTFTEVAEQQIVTGKIVSIGDKDVVIDIGFKSDGIVAKNEFDEELNIGDEVEVFLERMEDRLGQLVLSKTKADTVRRWRKIEDAFEGESVLEGTIVRRIKGGMIVELFEGLEAFLPGSQIDVRPVRDFDAYLDKRMEFKIVKLNPANENIVVSHKALIEKDLQKQRESILSTMEPGQILEGTVKNITDFGVFIDLGGVDGLLHITDLSWGRVTHPSELVGLDDKLNVVVLDYDKERQRISLGLKQLHEHPWENIMEKFGPTAQVEGKVVSITDYGAFVELEKGIEGLVHISEMSWTEHIRHPSQMVALGQVVQVKILNIDHDGKKISLGMKQLEPDPWQNIAERYPPGTVMRGKVRNITNFGVFVEIEPGIDGLVHISDLSWTKKIRHPSEMVKKGLEMDVVVLNIDSDDRRISLGHKQVDTNPWNGFQQVYAIGTDTSGTVVRVEDRGIVVELPLDVEAFIPLGELKNAGTFDASYHEGDALDALRVIRFDMANKEITVSEVAVGREMQFNAERTERAEKRRERQEEVREVQKYTQEASATGPTTLGELSGLEALKAKMEAAEAEAAAPAVVEKPAAEKPKAKAKAKKKAEAPAEEVVEAVAETEAPAKEEVAEAVAETEAPAKEEVAEAVAETEAPAEEEAAAEAEKKA